MGNRIGNSHEGYRRIKMGQRHSRRGKKGLELARRMQEEKMPKKAWTNVDKLTSQIRLRM